MVNVCVLSHQTADIFILLCYQGPELRNQIEEGDS